MKNGWYLTQAHAGDYEDVDYLLFEVDDALKATVKGLRLRLAQIEAEFGGWGSICLNGIINMEALKRVPAALGLDDAAVEAFEYGNDTLMFVGKPVDLTNIADDDVWRSVCQAVRVTSSGVHIRALSKYNSTEAESDDLSELLKPGRGGNVPSKPEALIEPLKPCPLCRSRDTRVETFGISCRNCGLWLGDNTTLYCAGFKSTRGLWNDRPGETNDDDNKS